MVFGSNQSTAVGSLFNTEVVPGDYIFFDSAPQQPLIVYQLSTVNPNTELYTTTYNWNAILSDTMMVMHESIELPYTTFAGVSSLTNGDYQINITYQLDDSYSEDINGVFKFSVCCTDYCGVYQKLADLADDCDDCYSEENVLNALLAWALLQSANGAAACGYIADSDVILGKLQRYIDNKPCNCK
jgi:hypothetical protein